MKILITGINGLVGSSLYNETLNDNKNEYVYLSRSECDLTDELSTTEYFCKHNPEFVVHLASIVNGATDAGCQLLSFVNNSKIHINVFNACIQCKVKKIITILSVAMCKENNLIDNNSFINGPDLNTNVHEGYVHSKRVLQTLCTIYQKKYGHVILLAPVNIYGAQDLLSSSRIIPSIYKACINNNDINLSKESYRQLLYNKDLASIILKFICLSSHDYINASIIGNVYVVGNSDLLTTQNIVETILNNTTKKNIHDVKFNENNNYSRECCITSLPFEFKYTSFQDAFCEIVKNLRI